MIWRPATGWSRDNAWRALRNVGAQKGRASQPGRAVPGRGYSYDALKVLIEIWSVADEPSGKYLKAVLE